MYQLSCHTIDDVSTIHYPLGMQEKGLTEEERRAWLGYRLMRRMLDAELNRALAHDTGLSEPDYDVLSNVSARPGHRWRMSDLGAHMLWSKSRLSHHISRMEERGLVRREEVDGDGRGTSVVLTEAGISAIRSAAPLHLRSVRRHFLDHLTADEVTTLGHITTKILDHLGKELPPA